jgi:hypothetical protein
MSVILTQVNNLPRSEEFQDFLRQFSLLIKVVEQEESSVSTRRRGGCGEINSVEKSRSVLGYISNCIDVILIVGGLSWVAVGRVGAD